MTQGILRAINRRRTAALGVAAGVMLAAAWTGSLTAQKTPPAEGGARGRAADPTQRVAFPGGFHSGVQVDSLIRPGEVHFKHLYQLTNGGENAEAYFSWDGSRLILQATVRGAKCDQIYELPSKGGDLKRVSAGTGRCTCSYFFPGDREILYSSTHLVGSDCPSPPDLSKGYVWALYPYSIFKAKADGSERTRLTETPGYNAEATVGPDGRIVFTSDRDGDLELYIMNSDGSGVKRLTYTPGYDGGAFFSADGERICYRGSHPTDPKGLKDFQGLLHEHLVRPGDLEIHVMDVDGTNDIQLTENGAANFCPFFTPDGKRVIYTSNVSDPAKRNFDLYLVDIATKAIEQVTFEPTFDGFPMFSPDALRLVFASNRNNERMGETNIFMADWAD